MFVYGCRPSIFNSYKLTHTDIPIYGDFTSQTISLVIELHGL